MNEELQYRHLLNLPEFFTLTELKKAYRTQALEKHPDKGGNERAFIEISKAYEYLSQCVTREEDIPVQDNKEYGRGLGPTTNGRTCTYCKGFGFLYRKKIKEVPCSCTGGKLSYPIYCNKCDGTGKYRGGKNACWTCGGTGIWKVRTRIHSVCLGTGWKLGLSEHSIREECYKCEGKGETMVFNPVFQKGGIF